MSDLTAAAPASPGDQPLLFYDLVPSAFGTLGLLWREAGGQATLLRVLLSTPQADAADRLSATFPAGWRGSHPAMARLAEQLQAFLQGEDIRFSLEGLAWEACSGFQCRVLLAEYGIPRGRVSTYGLIAAHLDVPGGARAVGAALAHNPFPLIIPCHRAIRSDGHLGGYQGGLPMKRRLLQMEGVAVSEQHQVMAPRWYYLR